MVTKQIDSFLMVAALDFGTTYSGYAFSMKDTFKNNPLNIHANQAWNSGGKQLLSLKTPTCLLLDKNKEFVSFGYDAENKYVEIVMEEEQDDYYYFHRFKMNLYNNKNIKADMLIEDLTGKSLPAIDVFSSSIKALTSHLKNELELKGTGVLEDDIKWVLTVPAIWSETAKLFMRKSAIQAGISDANLLIALEPEAASIYCQYLPLEKLHGVEERVTTTAVGKKYLVADLGGGTADITVHEKTCFNTIKEVCKASGNDCGGTSVDGAFFQMLVKIFGAPLLNLLKREDPSSYLDLFREFETVKRTITAAKTGKVNITMPYAALDQFCKRHLGEDLPSTVGTSPFAKQIIMRADKMRVDVDVIKALFKSTIDNIIALIGGVLRDIKSPDHFDILLVGGFSDSALLQHGIQKSFPEHRVIIPEDAGLSVLKGAVLFGHDPDKITSRILRVTYGTRMLIDFDTSIHDSKRLFTKDGIRKCDFVFQPIANQGEEMKCNTIIKQTCTTFLDFQNSMFLDIYVSDKKNPKYTDEGDCTPVGNLLVDIANPSKEIRSVDVQYCFGNTELSIRAKDRESGKEFKTSFNLI